MAAARSPSDFLSKDHYQTGVTPFARAVPTAKTVQGRLAPSAPHQHWHILVALEMRHMSAEASLKEHNLFSPKLQVDPSSVGC